MSQGEFHKAPNGKNVNVFTWEFATAAEELGLSYKFITPEHEATEKYIEITDGVKIFRALKAMTPLNDAVAPVLAKKKPATNLLLKEAGIPVPNQVVITNSSTEKEKISKLTYPLVVKPLDQTGGSGITANIKDEDSLQKAISEAKTMASKKSGKPAEDEPVIIEEMIKGEDHRLLVLENRVIAAIRKHPPVIISDGTSTVQQLIDTENETEIRKSRQISTIKVDNDLLNTLKDQGYTLESTPEKGLQINLHVVANLSRGATTENITEIIHPKFQELAAKATQVVGLKLAGVDFLAEDISKPPEGQAHGIIEVNAHPGSRLHLYPTIGEPINTPKIILEHFFNL